MKIEKLVNLQHKKQISNGTDIQNSKMLKICLSQLPTERRLLQFRVQRDENGGLKTGDHPVDKVVYGKKV